MRETGRSWRDLVSQPTQLDAAHWQRKGFLAAKSGIALRLGLLRYGGFRATVLHRIAHWGQANRIHGLPSTLHSLNQALHGIEITPSMFIGPGLYLPHTVGSVVTAASIGRNVELQGGITLGQRKGNGFPRLADDVVVSCGARVLGSITIGAGATIGANAVVINNVPPGAVMVGIPARPITRNGHGDPTTSTQSKIDGALMELSEVDLP